MLCWNMIGMMTTAITTIIILPRRPGIITPNRLPPNTIILNHITTRTTRIIIHRHTIRRNQSPRQVIIDRTRSARNRPLEDITRTDT